MYGKTSGNYTNVTCEESNEETRCIVNSTILQVTITGLEPFTSYFFIVSAINDNGTIQTSNELEVKTDETGKCGRPFCFK